MSHPFSVRLPSGQVRPFQHAAVLDAYVTAWPDADFLKVWPTPYCCLIQAKVCPL